MKSKQEVGYDTKTVLKKSCYLKGIKVDEASDLIAQMNAFYFMCSSVQKSRSTPHFFILCFQAAKNSCN